MTDDGHDPDLERRLASWRPSPIDRDRMLFAAGAASARARGRDRLWALALAASLLISAGLSFQLVRERQQRHLAGLDVLEAKASVEERPTVAPFDPPILDADRQRAIERRVIEMVERLDALPDGPDQGPPIRIHDVDRLLDL
ncbi:hypothetical protein TA3x_005493 [Tundrisphaera sp. TA3]|uniref:hypothetical protein n=1 Tax=Tundrisphaera sp. TA3 TaxID=3435775 RepID=UPI003EBEF9EC